MFRVDSVQKSLQRLRLRKLNASEGLKKKNWRKNVKRKNLLLISKSTSMTMIPQQAKLFGDWTKVGKE